MMASEGWIGRGWRLLRALQHEMQDDRVLSMAAGATFYTVLAMVPAISVLVSLFGLVANPADARQVFEGTAQFLPADAASLLTDQAVRIAGTADDTLSLAAVVALLFALWSATGGTKALMESLTLAWDQTERRGFLQFNAMALGLTLGGLVVVMVLTFLITALPVLLAVLGLGALTEGLLLVGRWPFVVLLMLGGLAVIYRLGPDRPAARLRFLTPGAVTAAVLLILCSLGFGYYVTNFADYDSTYGPLAGLAVTMIWIWLSTVAVLIGAELNALIEAGQPAS
jgi:membrane protein